MDDMALIRHMLDAAREILTFSAGKSRSDLDRDRLLGLALVHLLEIIGEAASGVSLEFRARHPDVPWGPIVAMRDRLIQRKLDLDLDIVWKTVELDLPCLAVELAEIVEETR